MISFLIEKFDQRTLPKSEWTHEAHLTVALWYIHTYEFDDAVCRLKLGIILLNNFHGTENTKDSGYHETLTIFWAQVISIYLRLNTSKDIEGLTANFLKSALASRSLPFKFYGKRELLSSNFRAIYKEPTLEKLTLMTI
jgi:hypothetical protein